MSTFIEIIGFPTSALHIALAVVGVLIFVWGFFWGYKVPR